MTLKNIPKCAEGGKPLNRDAIESVLRHGNSALKDHLPVPINLRNSGKEEWVKTILDKFNIKPCELKCTDKEITKLIPKMADLIFEKLNNNPNSESSDVLKGNELVSSKTENFAASLGHLSVKVVNLKDLLAADVHPHLVLLSDEKATADEKEAAAMAVYELLEKADNHEALLDAGVHRQLGLLLVDSQASAMVKSFAAEALWNLSKNVANHEALVAAGVHKQLGALLVDSQVDFFVKKAAAAALYKLSENVANHPALVTDGIHTQWGALLVDSQPSAHLKEAAAAALYKLSSNTDNHVALVKGGVHKQLGVLLMGGATDMAKEAAAEALMNLSKNLNNDQALIKADVHTQLVGLLSDPQATADAKKYAAMALMNLSKNEAIQPQLIAADVHAGLVQLLSDSKATAGAKEYAAKALCNLSIGAHDQMFAIVRDPEATFDEKGNVAKVLKTLSAEGDNHQALLAAGVHTQLVKRLFDDGTNPDSKKSASMALWNLMTKRPMTHSQEQSFNRKRDGTMFMGKSNWFGKRIEGITITKNGQIFEGVFKYGKLEGKGTFTSPDGTSITGEFRNGQPIGVCTRTSPNGRKTEYQETYTGADKEMTKEELNRRMAAPRFVELLTGEKEGTVKGHVLPLISTHLKYLAPARSPMEKLASQLDFAAEIENEEASVSIEKIKERLKATPADKEVVIFYGRDRHAMLLKLKFTDLGLNVEIYNSGEGLTHRDKHPELGVNKYNTCKEKFYPDMRPDSPEFDTLLIGILKYPTFKTIDQSYAVFAGAQDVVSVAPNWQRDQKGQNCTLECVMAFLKKNMSPADYLQYRMTLISDVKTQAEVHKGSYEETLDPKVANRLDQMLENRKVKQSQYRSEPVIPG